MFADDEKSRPLAYVIFGDVLLPFLEKALFEGDLQSTLKICAFLEDAAVSSRQDQGLKNLIVVEIGEWLEWTPSESLIGPWLGPETKRICRYVPGLAIQRNELRDKKKRSLFERARDFVRHGF